MRKIELHCKHFFHLREPTTFQVAFLYKKVMNEGDNKPENGQHNASKLVPSGI